MLGLPVSADAFMRLAGLLVLVFLVTTPARAQHVDADGFSICSIANSGGKLMQADIGPCQPLSEPAMQSFGLSAGQTAIVAALRGLAAGPGVDRSRVVFASLAPAQPFAAVGAFADDWFPDGTQPGNIDLGVHLRYKTEDAKPQLFQMTYAVDGDEGHFTVLWNRALASPRR